jgi:glycosyl transferase family 2
MKLVMTMLVRDEEDILDANLAFHLNAGVDFVIATDNGSTDGTAEILSKYALDGYVHTISKPGLFSQIEQVTLMARLAATDFQADWVVNSDADEFWWPRGGSLKDVFAAVPPRFGSVRGMWRHFVPRPFGPGFFAERMTVRLCVPIRHRFNAHFKTAHRADPAVRVGGGNHDVTDMRLPPLVGWYPIDILHFPLRSLDQSEQKLVRWWLIVTNGGGVPVPRMQEGYDAHREGRMQEYYDSYVVDDDALARGLCDGTLALDTRLRDVLRLLAGDQPGRGFEIVGDPSRALDFTDTRVDQGYLSELGVLEEQGPLVQTQRRMEALETRLSALEQRRSSPFRTRVSARSNRWAARVRR